jgi:hypothetical protein
LSKSARSPFDRLRTAPFDKLSTAPFDKLSTAPFDKLRAQTPGQVLDALMRAEPVEVRTIRERPVCS